MPRKTFRELQDVCAAARFSLAEPVTYTPAAGAPIDTVALYMRSQLEREESIEFRNVHAIEAREQFQLRRAVIAQPQNGDTILYRGVTYKVAEIDESHSGITDITVIVKRA